MKSPVDASLCCTITLVVTPVLSVLESVGLDESWASLWLSMLLSSTFNSFSNIKVSFANFLSSWDSHLGLEGVKDSGIGVVEH